MAEDKAMLHFKSLWDEFHKLDNEMIITKTGRRMFPTIRVQLYELDPTASYCILLEMVPIGNCRHKYSPSSGWAPAGAEEAQSLHRVYLHPESPATGEHWMSQPISFSRIKLTNTPAPPPGQLVLTSMHKYQPRIVIIKTADPRTFRWSPTEFIIFEETQFIAVTAYQNERITKLKIDNNPFAKGFRANGHSKCRRKRPSTESQETPPEEESKKTISESAEVENILAQSFHIRTMLYREGFFPYYVPCSPSDMWPHYLPYHPAILGTKPCPPISPNSPSKKYSDFTIERLIS